MIFHREYTKTQWLWRSLAALLLLSAFGFFLLMPVLTIVKEGLNWRVFCDLIGNPVYRDGIVNSLLLAVTVTGMVMLLALPLALLFDRFDFPGKPLCSVLILVPMILPPFVGALGFQQIFGYYGVLNTLIRNCGGAPVDFLGGGNKFWAVAVIEALHLYPILYLNAVAALANLDPALDKAARNLGTGRWRRFFRITLPLIRPGIFAGSSLVLIWSFTELGTPLMFHYNRVAPVQIFDGLTELESNPVPYTLVVILMILSALLYFAGKLVGSSGTAMMSKGGTGSAAKPLSGPGRWLPFSCFGIVTLAAALPHAALILIAFSSDYYRTLLPHEFTLAHFQAALGDPLVVPSIVNSLQYSVTAMVLALLLGVLCALLIARWKFPGAALFDVLSMLPLAIPGLVMAFGFLSMTIHYPWLGKIFDPVQSPLLLLSSAYAIRRLPYVVRSAVSGLEQTPVELERAASSMGASPWRVLRRITVPLIAANLLIGALFAFSFSMLEVSDSLLLVQRSVNYPITKAIFELSQVLGSGPASASAFGVWTMLFMAATLGAAAGLLGRRLGTLFRL